MYYSYHNLIKKKIAEGKLIKVEYKNNYKNIGRVMILYFVDGSKYPIREYAWSLYQQYID